MKNFNYFLSAATLLVQYLFFYLITSFFNISLPAVNAAFLIYVFLIMKERVYTFDSYLIWDELKKHGIAFFQFVVVTAIFSIRDGDLKTMFKLQLSAFLFSVFSFFVMKAVRNRFFRKLKKNLLIIGTGREAQELTQVIRENRFAMHNLMGYLSTDKCEETAVDKDMILGSYKDIELIKSQVKIDEVIIALPSLENNEMNSIVERIEGEVSKIKFIPNINRMYTINPSIQDYDGIMLISARNKIASRKRKIIKRAMDICFGIGGMIALLPLTILVWLKTDRKERAGGIFYNQPRIGLQGESIKIYKYRSMVIGAEQILKELMEKDPEIKREYEVNKKLKNDPRITKIGAFLRRTSLDEFPQFLNVIKGEMSFIGPRPYLFGEKPDIGKYYDKIVEFKPGITGMWQTHGRSETDFNERLLLDEYYYRNWSIWLDIVIFIKTVRNVLGKKGAY